MLRPRHLELPHGYQTVIDEADWPLVEGLTLYRGVNGYVYYSVWGNGKSRPYTLHALLMKTPAGMHTDHVNGDKLDNRRSNLRIVTPSVNGHNRQSANRNSRSGIKGVSYSPRISESKPWRAQITVDRKNRHLGLFATSDEAIAARQSAEAEIVR